MPIHDYKCSTCEKEFEIIQKMNSEKLTRFPGCDNPDCAVVLKPSFAHIKFVGSGFYATDYRGK